MLRHASVQLERDIKRGEEEKRRIERTEMME
jgi:hypothetical protein